MDFKNNDWDYAKLTRMIPSVVRFMDNVNDITNVPLEEQKENLKNKRRIGLGITGYGSALMMLRIKYGSAKALNITKKLMSHIANEAYKSSALLAKEKGAFPLFDKEKYLESNFIKVLKPETRELIKKYGMRNSHLLSIQPNGNSSVFSNNISGGLEPVFLDEYVRTAIVPHAPEGLFVPDIINWGDKKYEGEQIWTWIKEGDTPLLHTEFDGFVYKIDKSRGLLKETLVEDYSVKYLKDKGLWDKKADWVSTTATLTVTEHVETMKVLAKYIDSAMSKTLNFPNDYPYEDFKKVYTECYDSGTIKGCTTYRAGTMTTVLSDVNKEKRKSNDKIQKTTAPKRPSALPCDIHHLTVKGKKWIVLVGLLDGDPYEVFAFKKKDIKLSDKWKEGELHKVYVNKEIGSVYNLHIGDFELDNIVDKFERDEEEALTRLISTSLRHGADINFVFDQLIKSEGTVVSFSKAISRTLKKYIAAPKVGMDCPKCGAKDSLRLQEGCFVCTQCFDSKCS